MDRSTAAGALPCFVAGKETAPRGTTRPLTSPIDEKTYAHLAESVELVSAAVDSAHAAFVAHRKATLAQRNHWLQGAASTLEKCADEIVALLIRDIGKPKRAARFETQRSVQFLRATAAAAAEITGETIPVDSALMGAGRCGFTRRVPYGVVAAITPFNAPINLLVQKVAPALAAGNAVVAKPHPAGTRVALRVAQAFAEAGLPPGMLSVLTGERDTALALVEHAAVSAVTFTGGTSAGDALVRAAGAKKFVAELGSNAANVVLADADVADAARRIASAAFEASGQQCISAQRIIVERAAYDAFLAEFVAAAKALKVGPPDDETVDVGPMVSRAAATRVMAMLENAVRHGGQYALKPVQTDCTVSPAIVTNASAESALWREEAFGPVALVVPAMDVDEALRLANDSPFGLQGALFTRSLKSAFRFAEELEVGSLWVNEASRFRLDMVPFGGVKRSGFGREGVRYAIEEMSQLKFVGLRFDA